MSYYFIQTLTELDLARTLMSHNGAYHIGQLLRYNTVKEIVSTFDIVLLYIFYHADAYNT